ncbi:MAG: hypothetical protein J7M18_07795 [Candidatus Eremiobacteraeota bacterium]|nr:hypothetical protein [Candidatus Eremiobacteraeota bacterium]
MEGMEGIEAIGEIQEKPEMADMAKLKEEMAKPPETEQLKEPPAEIAQTDMTEISEEVFE